MNLQSKLGEQLKGLAEARFSKEDWEKALILSHTEPDLRDPKDKEDLTNLLIKLMDEEQQRLWTKEQRLMAEEQRLMTELLLRKSHGFSDRLLCLVPLKHREQAYEPSKCDAETNRLERFEKDGNELAANREYLCEIRKLVLSTFLALPGFYIGEILDQVRRIGRALARLTIL